MITTTGAVHISFILAITIVIIVQLKTGRSVDAWLPLITGLVGYLFPSPNVFGPKKGRSASLLHLDNNDLYSETSGIPMSPVVRSDPDYEPTVGNQSNQPLPMTRYPSARNKLKPMKTLLFEVLPSCALFGAALLWVLLPPPVAEVQNTTIVGYNTVDEPFSEVTYTMPGTALDVLDYGLNITCVNPESRHVLLLHGGVVGMCRNNNHTFVRLAASNTSPNLLLPESTWRDLMARVPTISHRLHSHNCKPILVSDLLTAQSCEGYVYFGVDRAPDAGFKLNSNAWITLLNYAPMISKTLHMQ